jgi:2'-5' RNA ligase superfamily
MAHSVLLVPVPELEFVVRPRVERRTPSHLSADPEETHAHVTLLGPFATLDELTSGVFAELRSFFSDVTPFLFNLTAVREFPGGAAYLSPDPATPFRQLTNELFRRFPEYPPYGRELDDVVPHLSVYLAEDERIDQLRRELAPRLPIRAQAMEASLVWFEPGRFRTLETFPFGTSAA